MTVAPVPIASVAVWKTFVKEAPVEPVPEFEMVEDRVTAVPAVAVVGVIDDVVRSAIATLVTETEQVAGVTD